MKWLYGSGGGGGALFGLTGSARSAFACGGGGVTGGSGVRMNTQRIVMSVRASGTTDMIAQVGVPATTADYGVLIPVPSEPTLDDQPISTSDLQKLDDATRPEIYAASEG